MSLLRLESRPRFDHADGVVYVIHVLFPSGEDSPVEVATEADLDARMEAIAEALGITNVLEVAI